MARQKPKNLREAIEAGDVLAVAAFVRAMSPEEAEKELLKQDRCVKKKSTVRQSGPIPTVVRSEPRF